jgi:predicted phosphodiesterase
MHELTQQYLGETRPANQSGNSDIFPRKRKLTRRAARGAVNLIAAGAVGGLGVLASGGSTIHTEGLGADVQIEPVFSADFSGGTTLDSSLGQIVAPTHIGPFGIDIRVSNISPEQVLQGIQDPGESNSLRQRLNQDLETLTEAATDEVKKDVALFVLFGAGGWAVSDSIGRRRSRKDYSRSFVAGLSAAAVAAAAIGGTAWRTADGDAFNKATFSGGIAFAQEQVGLLDSYDLHDEQVAAVVGKFMRLTETLQNLTSGETEDTGTQIMVISDIHSRNVYPLLHAILEANPSVDAVLDAGDLTEWGQVFENGEWRQINEGIASLEIPYFFVKGNHDSEQTVQQLGTVPNVIVLDGQVETFNGIRIIGVPHPDFTPDDMFNSHQHDRSLFIDELRRDFAEVVEREKPDIAVIHDPEALPEDLEGTRIVISGHTHVPEPVVEQLDSGTVSFNQGSTGGAFLRVMDNEAELPQTVSIVHFDAEGRPKSSTDLIITSFDGLQVERNENQITCEGSCLDNTN